MSDNEENGENEENHSEPSDTPPHREVSASASAKRQAPRERSFRRTYVACIPCRSKKVRCIIRSRPPCAKCVREHRECIFSKEKQPNKSREPPIWAHEATRISTIPNPNPTQGQDQELNSQIPDLTSTSTSTSTTSPAQSRDRNQNLSRDLEITGGLEAGGSLPKQTSTDESSGSVPTLAPSIPPPPPPLSLQEESHHHRRQSTTLSDQVIRTVVAKSTDALDLLFDAAQVQSDSYGLNSETFSQNGFQPRHPPTTSNASKSQSRPLGLSVSNMNGPSDFTTLATPESGAPATPAISNLSYPTEDVLDTWGKSRFVIQGWFTAQEAVTYVDLFFQNMADLSPILPQFYRYHSNHYRLVSEEPMLCTSILMISSRYHTLPGVGGISRGYHIHQRLWHHCEHLLQRVMLGQEKYSTAKTRTIGTIEGLLLISEWNPRAILFPPDSDGWDAHLLSNEIDPRHRSLVHDQSAPARWREDVFLPAKRSDCMSWMLVGAATSLAYELGIFTEDGAVSVLNSNTTERHSRIQKLLYVYVNQIATRIGCASMLPQNISHLISVSFSSASLSTADHNWSRFMDHWIEITKLMKTALDLLFPSATVTKQILLNGRYITLLQHFTPSLTTWHEKFLFLKGLPKPLEDILFMEYHHVKAYVNSLAIQAVVERALARGVDKFGTDQGDVLHEFIKPQDYNFINEVMISSRHILQRGTSLVQSGSLKYTPIRTVLRITSASLFLLKSISLGGRNIDLQISLKILDESNNALRANPLDDMDLASRYATLIERHTERFRQNFSSSRQPYFPSRQQDNMATSSCNFTSSSRGIQGQMTGVGPSAQYDNTGLYNTQTFAEVGLDGWSAQPFDPSFAPFSVNGNQISLGFDTNSLDFLWNTPIWDE